MLEMAKIKQESLIYPYVLLIYFKGNLMSKLCFENEFQLLEAIKTLNERSF